MKKIIVMMIILGLLSGWTVLAKEVELGQKIELMLDELNNNKISLRVEKLILANIYKAYYDSKIQNQELQERIDNAIMRLFYTLNEKEKTFFSRELAAKN